jgi:hypothetical protein
MDPEETLGTLELRRDFVGSMGACDFCHEDLAHLMPDDELVLAIGGREFQWVLCDYHEGEMLVRMINNYTKRREKKRPGGYTGPFRKEDLCELCFDILSVGPDEAHLEPPEKEKK